MARFLVSVLAYESQLGLKLKAAREARRLSLVEASRRLKLPVRYLGALEAGRWHDLPEGSYARLFVRTYATFLGLPAEELLRQHHVPARARQHPVPLQPSAVQRVAYGRRALIVLGAVAVAVYLVTQAWQALEPPQLTLTSPAEAVTTFSPTVLVRGRTRSGTTIAVNGAAVEVSSEGGFSVPVALSPGLNTVTVVARKAYARPVTLVRRVLFTVPPPGPNAEHLLP